MLLCAQLKKNKKQNECGAWTCSMYFSASLAFRFGKSSACAQINNISYFIKLNLL